MKFQQQNRGYLKNCQTKFIKIKKLKVLDKFMGQKYVL